MMDENPEEPRPIKPFEAGEDTRLRKRDVARTTALATLVGSGVLILGASGAIVLVIVAVCA